MFKTIAVLLILVSAQILMAGEVAMPTCKINAFSDASKCIRKISKATPEYNLANDGLASSSKVNLVAALKAIDLDAGTIAKVYRADYVGAVLQYGDEVHIIYYAFTKGGGYEEIYDLNIVDLGYMLIEKGYVNDFFLGLDGSGYVAYQDVVDHLKDFDNK
ncbi:MAG: hypothetical protein K2Q18_01135 [Bdellovibrionales bacterium]|nr:hypothetical protein [Bdellovibrionales bacterium]